MSKDRFTRSSSSQSPFSKSEPRSNSKSKLLTRTSLWKQIRRYYLGKNTIWGLKFQLYFKMTKNGTQRMHIRQSNMTHLWRQLPIIIMRSLLLAPNYFILRKLIGWQSYLFRVDDGWISSVVIFERLILRIAEFVRFARTSNTLV